MSTSDSDTSEDRDLVLERLIDAPAAAVYRAWTEPDLLKRWFAPKPFITPVAELDVRPGGSSLIVMRSAEGHDMPTRGVYLEVVPNRRIVLTDAYTEAWIPSPRPFMTLDITLEEQGSSTKYTARVRHWTLADKEAHEAMGFHQGWGLCADQLAAVAAGLLTPTKS